METTPQARIAISDKVRQIIDLVRVVPSPQPTFEEEQQEGTAQSSVKIRSDETLLEIHTIASSIVDSLPQDSQSEYRNLFGNDGVFLFILDTVSDVIAKTPWNAADESFTSLQSFLGDRVTEDLITSIIESIFSFPRTYEVILKLTGFKTPVDKESFCNSVQLVLADESFILQHSTEASQGITNISDPTFFSEQQNYLSLLVDGFLPEFRDSNINTYIEDKIYSCLGLFLSLGLVVKAPENIQLTIWEFILGPVSKRLPVYIFEHVSDGSPVFKRVSYLSDNARILIDRLRPGNWNEQTRAVCKTVLEMEGKTNEYATVAKTLLNASRWYFDSVAEPNQTHSYVQASIGFEVLFGEPGQKQNILERLTERFSYLMARSAVDRPRYAKGIKELYNLRSRIVHEGRVIFPYTDQNKLKQMRGALMASIRKEAQNLFQYYEYQRRAGR